jgi:predicted DNA-binding protein (MmcQ/YjbR family)
MELGPQAAALKARLDAFAGAVAEPMGRGAKGPLVLIYKVAGKMFAILGARAEQFVILKSDPHLAEVLREQYAGIGHRSHLDRRFWISVSLDADVPTDEIERLADASYYNVCAGLTKKQKAELASLAG